MQIWDTEALQIEVKAGDSKLPLKTTRTPFYSTSARTDHPTGVAFDVEDGTLCTISIRAVASPYPADCELIVAPNYDNPGLIKDRVVGAMIGRSIPKFLGWMAAVGAALIGVCIALLSKGIRRLKAQSSPS